MNLTDQTILDLRTSCRALRLEVSASVQDDVTAKCEAVIGRLEFWRTRAQRMERRLLEEGIEPGEDLEEIKEELDEEEYARLVGLFEDDAVPERECPVCEAGPGEAHNLRQHDDFWSAEDATWD